MIGVLQVNLRKDNRTTEPVQQLANQWEGIPVLYGYGVQLAVIDA
jgi:hypothetical protein